MGRFSIIIILLALLGWWFVGYRSWIRIIRKKRDFTVLDTFIGFFAAFAGLFLGVFFIKEASETVVEKKFEIPQKEAGDENDKEGT